MSDERPTKATRDELERLLDRLDRVDVRAALLRQDLRDQMTEEDAREAIRVVRRRLWASGDRSKD